MNAEVLKERQQRMIEMYESGCRISEIAAAFDIRESSVKSRLSTYRRKGLVGKRVREYRLPEGRGKTGPRPFEESKKPPVITDKLLIEETCDRCGKKFYRRPEWVYKKTFRGKHRIFCSWKCMREAEAAAAVRPKRKGT